MAGFVYIMSNPDHANQMNIPTLKLADDVPRLLIQLIETWALRVARVPDGNPI